MNIRCDFSPCRRYRYTWEMDVLPEPGKGLCVFIGLNPSTADENGPDPTVRRCIGYAARWGYGRLVMLNLFAYRATDPKAMMRQTDPVGPENDRFIQEVSNHADLIVAAWGNHGSHLLRSRQVLAVLPHKLHAIRLTQKWQPAHPLYLRQDLLPAPICESHIPGQFSYLTARQMERRA
jgi:hypothetical protein